MPHTQRQFNDLTTTAGTSQDPLGMDAVRAVARQIADAVRDPDMNPKIPLKIARDFAERKINASELAPLLESIIAGRMTGRINRPGAYFVTSIKRLYQKHEIPW